VTTSWRAGLRGDRGVALLLVVVALALLGALALGAFGSARLEERSASNLRYAAEAFEAAEAGLTRAADRWDTSALGAPVWVPRPEPAVVEHGARSSATVTRLNSTLYLIVGTGERLDGDGTVLARRVLGVIGKSQPLGAGGAVGFAPLVERSWVQLYN
jgi:hypothetical protein